MTRFEKIVEQPDNTANRGHQHAKIIDISDDLSQDGDNKLGRDGVAGGPVPDNAGLDGNEEGGRHGVQVWADDKDHWDRSSQNKPSQKEILFKNCVPVNKFMTEQNLELLIKVDEFVLEQDLMEIKKEEMAQGKLE
jgi:hypothetical protein